MRRVPLQLAGGVQELGVPLGKGVPADATEKITEAVKARIGFEDVKDDAEGVISKITGLFGKK